MENVPRSLRGELTRWMLELKAGVFVGKLSARVRDSFWQLTCSKVGQGAWAILLYSARTEQGFAVTFWGLPDNVPEETEGLTLIREQLPPKKRKFVERILRWDEAG